MVDATLQVIPIETNKKGQLIQAQVDIIFNDPEATHHKIIFDCRACPDDAMTLEEIKDHMVRMLSNENSSVGKTEYFKTS